MSPTKTATLRFLGVHVDRDRLNPETRRREPLTEPQVTLRLATGAGVAREVPLNRGDLARLIAEAAAANLIVTRNGVGG